MQALTDLGLAGNCLTALPDSIGQLTALQKLACNGNRLQYLPPSLTGLTSLKQLWLQRNSLSTISPVSGLEVRPDHAVGALLVNTTITLRALDCAPCRD